MEILYVPRNQLEKLLGPQEPPLLLGKLRGLPVLMQLLLLLFL